MKENTMDFLVLTDRIDRIERTNRLLKAVLCLTWMTMAFFVLAGAVPQPQFVRTLRTERLEIVDPKSQEPVIVCASNAILPGSGYIQFSSSGTSQSVSTNRSTYICPGSISLSTYLSNGLPSSICELSSGEVKLSGQNVQGKSPEEIVLGFGTLGRSFPQLHMTSLLGGEISLTTNLLLTHPALILQKTADDWRWTTPTSLRSGADR